MYDAIGGKALLLLCPAWAPPPPSSPSSDAHSLLFIITPPAGSLEGACIGLSQFRGAGCICITTAHGRAMDVRSSLAACRMQASYYSFISNVHAGPMMMSTRRPDALPVLSILRIPTLSYCLAPCRPRLSICLLHSSPSIPFCRSFCPFLPSFLAPSLQSAGGYARSSVTLSLGPRAFPVTRFVCLSRSLVDSFRGRRTRPRTPLTLLFRKVLVCSHRLEPAERPHDLPEVPLCAELTITFCPFAESFNECDAACLPPRSQPLLSRIPLIRVMAGSREQAWSNHEMVSIKYRHGYFPDLRSC